MSKPLRVQITCANGAAGGPWVEVDVGAGVIAELGSEGDGPGLESQGQKHEALQAGERVQPAGSGGFVHRQPYGWVADDRIATRVVVGGPQLCQLGRIIALPEVDLSKLII